MLNNNYEIDTFTFTRLDQLALGCILAILEFKGILQKMNKNLFLIFIITGFALVAFTGTLSYFNLNLFKHNAYGLLYFGVIGYCILTKPNTLFNSFLTSKIMQFLGKISYGLYIWHILAMLFFTHYFKSINIFFDFGVMFLMTIIMSTLSFYLLENRFLQLKKYFTN